MVMLLGPVVLSHAPTPQRAESDIQPPFVSTKQELSAMRALPAYVRPYLCFSEPSQMSVLLQTLSPSFAELAGKDTNSANNRFRPGQEKELHSTEAQPATAGKGWVCGLSTNSPPAGPGRALWGALLIPASVDPEGTGE